MKSEGAMDASFLINLPTRDRIVCLKTMLDELKETEREADRRMHRQMKQVEKLRKK